MTDCKLSLIKAVERSLVNDFTQDEIIIISDKLAHALYQYSVSQTSTDITPYEDINQQLIKQYSACLFVDGKSKWTIYQYTRSCNKLQDYVNKNFTEMTASDVRYYLACEKDRGISGRSVENLRANLSAFFQWMTNEGIIDKNPLANIKPIKYADTIRKPFSETEIDNLRSACVNEKERALIELLLSSGMRVSEVVNLDVTDIDERNLSVHVRHSKGNKQRITYITNVAMMHLNHYINNRTEKGTVLFYSMLHERITSGGIRYILNNIASRANVKNVHPHRFRRTFASSLAAKGMDIYEIKKLLGHTDINTTMEYVYMDDNQTMTAYRKHIS